MFLCAANLRLQEINSLYIAQLSSRIVTQLNARDTQGKEIKNEHQKEKEKIIIKKNHTVFMFKSKSFRIIFFFSISVVLNFQI